MYIYFTVSPHTYAVVPNYGPYQWMGDSQCAFPAKHCGHRVSTAEVNNFNLCILCAQYSYVEKINKFLRRTLPSEFDVGC